MKKLILALSMLLASSAQALPPYGVHQDFVDPSGDFFWGFYMVPPVTSNRYLWGYDGSVSIPSQSPLKFVAIGAGLSYDGTTLAATGGTGTVTSVTCGTGLNGGTITSAGTCSLPNTGTAGSYNAGVTTDTQGRVTAGVNVSINDGPSRSLVTTTSSTGFQISSTRDARVCYEGSISTTSTIGGPASATVFLETADTNSTTPGDWTTKAKQTYSNTITLAVVLNQVQSNNWTMCRRIPAGKYVRIRSGSISGTASVTLNTEQQEETL